MVEQRAVADEDEAVAADALGAMETGGAKAVAVPLTLMTRKRAEMMACVENFMAFFFGFFIPLFLTSSLSYMILGFADHLLE